MLFKATTYKGDERTEQNPKTTKKTMGKFASLSFLAYGLLIDDPIFSSSYGRSGEIGHAH